MCARFDFISPQSPLRAPGWRWLRACQVVENRLRVRVRDDDRVRDAVAFYRALQRCQNERGRARLARKIPAFFEAWLVYQQSSLKRWELEARLLANEETDAIVRKCGLSANAVEVFHDTEYRWAWGETLVLGLVQAPHRTPSFRRYAGGKGERLSFQVKSDVPAD